MLGALAAIWAIVVALTGGFVIHLGSIRVSSRSPYHAALLAWIGAVAAWGLSTPAERLAARERLFNRSTVAACIALVGAGLLIHQWDSARPLWLDEEMIALNLRDRAIADLAGPLWLGQSAPFGWLVVQRAMLITFGTGELAVRFIPVLFGLATLACAVWVGRRWMTPVGAAVLALLCSFGQWLSFHSLELKHYSANTFWALLLPALAVWVMEPASDGATVRTRHIAAWWAAAALGLWFADGALLVTPGCALVMFAVLVRRGGARAAAHVALPGFVWLASFGLHYVLAVRHSLGSEYLRSYWSFAMPALSAGPGPTLAWFAGQLEPLAVKPGGSGFWGAFWLSAACGFALSANRTLGIMLATVPLSAFVLAALRLVPLYERLSLWILPALYVGIALFIDSTARLGRHAYVRRSWAHAALTGLIAMIGLTVSFDVVWRGTEDLRLARPTDSNHGLDDRSAVGWLMQQRQPGDAWLTTRYGLPAVWWYGGIPISDPNSGSGLESRAIFVAEHLDSPPECRRHNWREALKDQRRLLVYLGFRFDDLPKGFDDLLMDSLAEIGAVTWTRDFAGASRAAVIDLRLPPSPRAILTSRRVPAPDGCLAVRPARGW